MAIEHSVVADPDIHEPKGVAAATATHVYSSDGLGSGSWGKVLPHGYGSAAAGASFRSDGASDGAWLRVQGWGDYQDTNTTVGTPTQNIATTVRTQFLCDGGTLTAEKLPEDASGTSLWNTSTDIHEPIADGDVYHMRISFTAENYAGANPYIEVALDIGGAVGEIFGQTFPLVKGGAAQKVAMSIPVYTGSTYLANGGTVYLTYTGTGTCDIFKNSVFLVREAKAYI